MARPTIKPKRFSTSILLNTDLPDKIQAYVIKMQEANPSYSMSDFINEAIIDKLCKH